MFDGFSAMFPFFIMIFVLYGVLCLLALAQYIVTAIGIMRLSASRGLSNGWLGFIPVASLYQTGKIAGEVEAGKKKIKNTGLWMALLPAIIYGVFFIVYFIFLFSMIGNAFSGDFFNYGYHASSQILSYFTGFFFFIIFLSVFLSVGSIVWSILYLLVLYKIFAVHYSGMRALFYSLLSAYIPLAQGILFMKIAKEPIVNPPEYMLHPQPVYYGPQPYYGAAGQQPYPPQPYAPPMPQQPCGTPEQNEIQPPPSPDTSQPCPQAPYAPPPVQSNTQVPFEPQNNAPPEDDPRRE